MWQAILIATTLIFLIIASYSDIKKREVPDWLSYGLIFSALGLRLIFSFENGWGIFLSGLLGFLVCLGIAYLLYFLNQWGGGDSKLLMGMGAVIGLGLNFENFSDFNLLWFFLSLLFFGAVIGLLWSLYLAVKNWGKFTKEFKRSLRLVKKWHFLSLFLSLGFFVLSLFYYYFWILVILPIGSFYLFSFVKAVEKSCFVKEIPVNKLVEGDWPAEDIVVKGKKIMNKRKALEKKDIWKLMSLQGEGKLKKVLIKEGIPLVPSFLLAYLLITFGNWSWLMKFLWFFS